MFMLFFVLHLLVSALLCIVVLLQQSKGNGLAGAFGGAGAGEALFGARGVTTILHRATIYLGAAFMVLSLLLVLTSGRGGGSSLSQRAAEQLPTLPAAEPLPLPASDALPLEGSPQSQQQAPANSGEPIDDGGGQ
jgi:preprotein translocase subunit SecG